MAAILDTILGILGLFLRMGKVFEYFCCRCLVEFFCLKINERNVFFFFLSETAHERHLGYLVYELVIRLKASPGFRHLR